jgi:hypothetical protein
VRLGEPGIDLQCAAVTLHRLFMQPEGRVRIPQADVRLGKRGALTRLRGRRLGPPLLSFQAQ